MLTAPVIVKKKKKTEEDAVFEAINRCLRGDWSDNQLKKGLFFEIRDYWKPFYKKIYNAYTDAGWVVRTHIEMTPGKREIFLNIQHPTWSKKYKRR